MNNSTFTNYANSFQAIAKPGLENITALMQALGNPQENLTFLHVAGTNGKGSVCAFLEAMLMQAGYIAGKYTSPNLVRVNERICVNGNEISDEDLERILKKVEIGCVAAKEKTGVQPTQFEIWTAAAFCYFDEQGCDYVVLETGLGGELDATNIVKNTRIAAITHIALDHTEYLGNTLTSVASAKAGIIKSGCSVISAVQEDEVYAVLEQTAQKLACSFVRVNAVSPTKFDGIYEYLGDTKLALGGVHQLENAALAYACGEALGITKECIIAGLQSAKHPARFEKITEIIYYDGAHNPDGVQALLKNLNRYFPGKTFSFVMATMADKDITSALEMLKPHIKKLCTVTVQDNPRAMTAKAFEEKATALGIDAQGFITLPDAVRCASENADIVIICGSLYLYKDFDAVRKDLNM